MGAQPEPRTFQVRISPELRRLRADGSAARHSSEGALPAAQAPAPVPVSGPSPEAAAPAESAAAEPAQPPARLPPSLGLPGGRRHSLRRDGARPLVVEGLTLVRLASRTPLAGEDRKTCEQRLELMLAETGELYAVLTVLPPPESAGRPLHRAVPISGPDDLAGFLRGHRPEEAFSMGAEPSPEQAQWLLANRQALRASFAHMLAPLRGGSPH